MSRHIARHTAGADPRCLLGTAEFVVRRSAVTEVMIDMYANRADRPHL